LFVDLTTTKCSNMCFTHPRIYTLNFGIHAASAVVHQTLIYICTHKTVTLITYENKLDVSIGKIKYLIYLVLILQKMFTTFKNLSVVYLIYQLFLPWIGKVWDIRYLWYFWSQLKSKNYKNSKKFTVYMLIVNKYKN